jgi:Domain of unknown function (DUF4383)
MAHFPVNHHLRPLYRVLAGLCGIYVLAFGVTALVQVRGLPFFAQKGLPSILGLHANRAFAVLSIVAGAIILVGAIIGNNTDYWINIVGGVVFLLAGMLMLALLRTELNFLGFTVATCIVSFVIGAILAVAGLYGRVGTAYDVAREEEFRHGRAHDPQEHPVQGPAAT